jgi:ComF family protein
VASLSIASRSSAPAIGPPVERSWTGQIAETLFAVLFPSDCRICDAPLTRISRLPVCQECLDGMSRIGSAVCATCGERLFSSYALAGVGEESLCGLCRRLQPPFERAVAYGSYEGGLRELIHLLKYGSVRPAANVLGRMLAEAIAALEPGFFHEAVIVIPVPLHRSKLRQRNFNQAELIARAAMKVGTLRTRLSLHPGALERRRETASQTGLTSHQRRANLRGAFGVTPASAVKGREILLVDDVYTTGATVSECARVLRRAGAARVWVATVARTLKISAQHMQIGPVDIGEHIEEEDSSGVQPAVTFSRARAAGG